MKWPAFIVICSHLSDVQEMIQRRVALKDINQRLNFAKWLITKHMDSSINIDAQADWAEFKKEREVNKADGTGAK